MRRRWRAVTVQLQFTGTSGKALTKIRPRRHVADRRERLNLNRRIKEKEGLERVVVKEASLLFANERGPLDSGNRRPRSRGVAAELGFAAFKKRLLAPAFCSLPGKGTHFLKPFVAGRFQEGISSKETFVRILLKRARRGRKPDS
ncbi:hypothetical protein SUGI_0264400 [Cryptomeria japonica]|nr:hypothetical protein SUGI_0264400 [Cryptomeria japonica]